MGMFDSVYINCPNCNKTTECQTKSGSCLLNGYSLHNAPLDVLSGVIGTNWCDHCNKKFMVELIHKPIAVARPLTPDEEDS